MTTYNRQFRLASRPTGNFSADNFTRSEAPVPEPGEGEVLVRSIYLSLDPTNRIWMSDMEQYLPPVEIGEVMRGIGIGVVEQSQAADFAEGDLVTGMLGWQDYCVAQGATGTAVRKLAGFPGVPLAAALGPLGMTGCTAYFGLLEVGRPRAGETVVISAAAGAVGSIAGQIAKIHGCRVVGIAGSDKKCAWLTGTLGFDAAVNYKEHKIAEIAETLDRVCPDGIDIYFENVGGRIIDAVITHANLRARVVLCGLIAQYNATRPTPGLYTMAQVLMKRMRIEGFVVLDYVKRWPEAQKAIAGWIADGKIKYALDIVEGLENVAAALQKLFDGSNTGKLIVKVSEEPANF